MKQLFLFFVMLCLQVAFAQNNTIIFEDGSTALPRNTLTGNSMDVRPADLDGDGDLDLVIAMEFNRNIILINTANAVFLNESNARLPAAFNDSEDVGIADFDGDGDLDLIFVAEDDSLNELYLNDGSGFFTDVSSRLPVNGISNAVLTPDVDGDGDADILIGNQGQNRILLNDGNGFFTDASRDRFPLDNLTTQDLEWGDIDNDGDHDLIVANENGNRIWLNDGSGFFSDDTDSRLPLPNAGEETREADLGDVDGDGDLDLFLANVTFSEGRPSQNRLLLNDGSGFFSDVTATHLPFQQQNTVDGDLVDLDFDNDLDLITAQAFNGTYQILINDGSGVFANRTGDLLVPAPTGNGIDIEVADFNDDSIPDIYFSGFGQADYLYFGSMVSGIADEESALPKDFQLGQNYPNPFNPQTNIPFTLRKAMAIRLSLFDVNGNMLSELLNETRAPGTYQYVLDGSKMASGIYFYQLEAGPDLAVRKMILLR